MLEGETFSAASLAVAVDIAADLVEVPGIVADSAAAAVPAGTYAAAYAAVRYSGTAVRADHSHVPQSHPAMVGSDSAAVVGAAVGAVESIQAVDDVPFRQHGRVDDADAAAGVFVVSVMEMGN